jgi:hypothetical protein
MSALSFFTEDPTERAGEISQPPEVAGAVR